MWRRTPPEDATEVNHAACSATLPLVRSGHISQARDYVNCRRVLRAGGFCAAAVGVIHSDLAHGRGAARGEGHRQPSFKFTGASSQAYVQTSKFRTQRSHTVDAPRQVGTARALMTLGSLVLPLATEWPYLYVRCCTSVISQQRRVTWHSLTHTWTPKEWLNGSEGKIYG